MIRLTIPSLDNAERDAIWGVLESGYLVQGQQVVAFEQAIAEIVGTQYAVAVSSGTAALHLALLSLKIGYNDIVVTTAYSWPATANVIELCHARPVFVDIDSETYNISSSSLQLTLEKLMNDESTASRVKAILPVHSFGQLANMPAICKIAEQYNLPVIEDAACALGATLHSQPAGSWGMMGCFSFHPRKAITTGEGGIITTNDEQLANHLRALRNHGLDATSPTPEFILPGFNYRMTDLQGALGREQVKKLQGILASRRNKAAIYNQLFTGSPISSPRILAGSDPTYQSYTVLLPAEITEQRDQLIQQLREEGIETTIGTWHMPMISYYKKRYGYQAGDFPNSEDVFARSLTLPLHDQLTLEDQNYVVGQFFSQLPLGIT